MLDFHVIFKLNPKSWKVTYHTFEDVNEYHKIWAGWLSLGPIEFMLDSYSGLKIIRK